ncbi:MAG: 50S ribosomal protein L6 [Armatimonadetes bacterium]|nr:50S ribosomal protein L6 [Armatimonadota bacterium]
MSRIGLMPIPLPKGVTVTVDDANVVACKGPTGLALSRPIHRDMTLEIHDDHLLVKRPSDQREHRALHGLTRSLVANMVTGVTTGFEKRLEVFGLGYRAELDGRTLVLQVGYSHPCRIPIPDDLDIQLEQNRIIVRGADRERVGQLAANIRKLRKMSVYRPRGTDLRGIRYVGEKIRFKAGKAGKVGG